MPFKEYFENKICIVTGAASGIGFALSEALLKVDAVVVMADRDTETLESSVGRLEEYSGRAYPVIVDVTKQEQVQQLIDNAANQHGGIDVLFNNAGIGGTLEIHTVTLEHWRRIIEINLWGVIYGIHAALPIMRCQGRGHIVNTASIAGLMPFPYQALYATTKYGVVGMSECLRFELADEGISVSVVCPGDVATRIYGTPIIGERQEVKPPPGAITAEEAADTILNGVAKKEGIIALPERTRQLWREYWSSPEAADGFFLGIARERRRAYESGGSYYQVPNL
jgi:NAD(P)-dependent dehydrogenase (short-subunit alcohol dehydrogenase family)